MLLVNTRCEYMKLQVDKFFIWFLVKALAARMSQIAEFSDLSVSTTSLSSSPLSQAAAEPPSHNFTGDN